MCLLIENIYFEVINCKNDSAETSFSTQAMIDSDLKPLPARTLYSQKLFLSVYPAASSPVPPSSALVRQLVPPYLLH